VHQVVNPTHDATHTTGLGCFTCSTADRSDRSRIQPSYCFRGPTHYSPAMISCITTDARRRVSRNRPVYLKPAHERLAFDLYTHALPMSSLLSLLARGAKKPSRTSRHPPFLFRTRRPETFSEGMRYSPRQGSEATTKPCSRVLMGQRIPTLLRLSLLGWSMKNLTAAISTSSGFRPVRNRVSPMCFP